MSVLRTILRPGPIALGIAVAAFAALCFSVLAPWQLGKNTTTSHRNELIRHAVATPAVPIAEVVAPGLPVDPNAEWREVSLTGRYLPDHQVLVRLRSIEERPSVEVLVPFESAGTVYLVNRGYVRPPKAADLPDVPAPPDGTVTVDARIRFGEGTDPGRGVGRIGGKQTAYSIDPSAVATAEGIALAPFYLQLSGNQPGSLEPIPLPQLDAGPYLSYGLQWLAFGIMAPLGVVYFLVTEIRTRRRASAAAKGAGESPRPGTEADDATTRKKDRMRRAGFTTGSKQRQTIGAAPDLAADDDQVKRKLADRYGNG
ncbi:hypothetical protein HUN08_10950 [Gordonia sp. X0973]|uniref:SURF1 family cytochrome oxidase biogenesis protein n=1 Tax=Gordonia sp. X0973 TaxID=2742602 RepID=UPI000F52DBE6|nr:SURF1 family cytochrome oxidase biogenesis protein [Gordonia sp. X0973]QKT07653.1 hypothetical protein HUN08_10950 [Gordonia sp. X0973]